MNSNVRFAAAIAWVAVSGAVAAPAGAQVVTDTTEDAPPQIELHFDRLAAGADTFALVHQGRPIGRIFTALEREGEHLDFRERTETPMGHQETEVRFSATGEMRGVSQEGRMGPTEARIEIVYAGGRVRGEARVPQQGGGPPREYSIDAVGAGMPLAFLVTDTEPHTLLKILPAGPVEVVRESPVS